MRRRPNSSHIKRQIRNIESQGRQLDRQVKQAQRKANSADRQLRRQARTQATRPQANRQRLERELAKLERQPTRNRVSYAQSVVSLRMSLARLDESSPSWFDDELSEMSHGEAANGVAVLNALLETPDETEPGTARHDLRATVLEGELSDFDPDLERQWHGALFSLQPDNPDPARHFCSSAREVLSLALERAAPDDTVLADDPDCPRTPQGSVARRGRIRWCLHRQGTSDEAFEDFVTQDVDDVLSLFEAFNAGTHGRPGHFTLNQLAALKTRVEDTIRFLHCALLG